MMLLTLYKQMHHSIWVAPGWKLCSKYSVS